MSEWAVTGRVGVVAAVFFFSLLIAFGLHELERRRQRRSGKELASQAGAWSSHDDAEPLTRDPSPSSPLIW